MSIALTCEHCGSDHAVHPRMAGREIRCPSCDQVIKVPDAAVPEPTVPDETLAASDVDQPNDAIDEDPSPIAEVESSGRWLVNEDGSDSVEVEAAIPVAASIPVAMAVDEEEPWSSAEPPVLANMPSLEEEIDEADLVDDLFRRKEREDEELDMTPMVDVTFLLLIFFMVTASFTLQKSIQMPRQTTDLPSTANEDIVDELDVVELEIDEFGSFLVLAPDWERETPGKQNLTNTLQEAIAGRREGMKLNIKVHELARLQALVDGMDAGTIAGFSEIKVAQVDGFD